MERARRWEAREPDVFVSVFYGFPWSDVPDVGATIHVMTNDDQALADEIADDMSDFIWRHREAFAGETDIFIYPGYTFKSVDAMITNFHLPESTLLMLISAFAGTDEMLRCYQQAITEQYRFFSYGDAMFIE